MLTFTQLSVGAFTLGLLVERLWGRPAGSGLAQTASAISLAVVALASSVFHLGRPWLAWRAVLGLRTSWLSREVAMFGAFAALAFLYGLLGTGRLGVGSPATGWLGAVQIAAAIAGVLGVFCSVMVYAATKREQWAAALTGVRFFGTTVILGAALVLAVSAFTVPAAFAAAPFPSGPLHGILHALAFVVLVATVVKLCFEGSLLLNARDRRHSAHKRVAIVMLHDLGSVTAARFGSAIAGGVLLPFLVGEGMVHGDTAIRMTGAMLVLLVAGELAERYLFFRASPASRMPGGLP
jgi:DMSO reductase anchor subunit